MRSVAMQTALEMEEAKEHQDIVEIIESYNRNPEQLIPMLQDIQAKHRYLPADKLRALSKLLGVPLSQIYSVATFYRAFSLEPKGEHIIQVCMGTACHVRGAPRILDQLSRTLGVEPGKTSKDMKFTLETVNCLGSCALGPLVVIDGHYYGKQTPKSIEKIAQQYKGEKKAKKAAKKKGKD